MVTNETQVSVLLLEGHLTWGLNCCPLFNFVCVHEARDPHTRQITGTKSKTAVTSCLAGEIRELVPRDLYSAT